MSRSNHLTRKEARRRFAAGDMEAASIYGEKRNLKTEFQRYRAVWEEIGRPGKLLRNAVVLFAIRRILNNRG